jgi:flagellar M-ring protein FliF
MRDKFAHTLRRGTSTFAAFTPGQKAVTIAAVLAIAVGGYFFSTWASKPSYAPLFSNLAGADASAIVEKLSAAGTPYELANGGQTIMVPSDQVYDLRLQMSGEGLPAAQDSGYSLLDKQGITTSEFMQHVGYQRAMEGELSNTIKSIKGVKAATVHLAIPQKDIFAEEAKKPTASVLVATGVGQTLEQAQVQAIVHLVASSVEGLEPDQVTLAGADGRVLAAGGKQSALSGAGDARSQQTEQFEQRMGTSLQRMLDQVVGPGHAVVQVTADLDFDQTETKTQSYVNDPKVPALSESKSAETYEGANGQSGVLGPDNIQVPNAAGNTGTYSKSAETKNNAVGMVTESRKSAPGKVRKLGVAVLLDKNTANGVEAAKVEELVASAVGLDTKRGDTMAVSTMGFDQSAAKQAKEALDAANAAAEKEQMLSLGKTGAIALAILALVVLAMLAGRRRKRAQLTPAEKRQLMEAQAALEEARARAAELEAAPQLPAIEMAPAHNPSLLDPIEEGKQRDIAAMVERQPEEVAQVLRTWLADQRAVSR